MLIDKIALVTGAGREIGKEAAKTLARDGVAMIVNYNGSAAKVEETVAGIMAVGGKAETVQCSVSDFDKSRGPMDYTIKTYGKLDILVDNAGITRGGLLIKMSETDSDTAISTNLKGAFNCMQHVAHQVIKQRGGRVISIASVIEVMGNAGQVSYAASKVRIIGMTKPAAREMASQGIMVNAIASGFIVTEVTDVLSNAVKDAMKQQIPIKASSETSDVAETAAFLAPEEVRYITDQVVNVNDGMAIQYDKDIVRKGKEQEWI